MLPCEEELKGRTFQVREAFFEDMQPKRMNLFQVAGMDKHLPESRPIFLHHVKQFKCGCAIKIASQLQVQAVTIPVHKDPEIGCHDAGPLPVHSGFPDLHPENEAPRSPAVAGRGILTGIAPKLASRFCGAEALGEIRSSMQSRRSGTDYLGEGEWNHAERSHLGGLENPAEPMEEVRVLYL
jgi:hypothetical protein